MHTDIILKFKNLNMPTSPKNRLAIKFQFSLDTGKQILTLICFKLLP